MLFAHRMIIDNNSFKHRTKQILATIPDRPSMFYDKTLCEEFEEQFPFNYPDDKQDIQENINLKKQLKKKK